MQNGIQAVAPLTQQCHEECVESLCYWAAYVKISGMLGSSVLMVFQKNKFG